MPLPKEAALFLALNKKEQSEALQVAASETGRPAHLLEKDVWVVWTLNELFSAPFGEHLVFKGGTSLSKAYDIIDRFSEDIDVTYDVTALLSDLVEGRGELPPSASQARKWTKAARKRLPVWVAEVALPVLASGLERDGLNATLKADEGNLFLEFGANAAGTGYVQPVVVTEFGGRSTGQPSSDVTITCDAAIALPTLEFPKATVNAMSPKRTFWEKATAVHVYCLAGRLRGRPAFARHWYDLARLHEHGVAAKAIADRDVAIAVTSHKQLFFAEKTVKGEPIDYEAAVSGELRLVPDGKPLKELQADYEAMVNDGLLHNDATPFDDLVAKLREIEALANAPADPASSSA